MTPPTKLEQWHELAMDQYSIVTTEHAKVEGQQTQTSPLWFAVDDSTMLPAASTVFPGGGTSHDDY